MEERERSWAEILEGLERRLDRFGLVVQQLGDRLTQQLAPMQGAAQRLGAVLEQLGNLLGPAAEDVKEGRGDLYSGPHLLVALWLLGWREDLAPEDRAHQDDGCDWFLARLGSPPAHQKKGPIRAAWNRLSPAERRSHLLICWTGARKLTPGEVLADPRSAEKVLRKALDDHLPMRLDYDPTPKHQYHGKPAEHKPLDPKTEKQMEDRQAPHPLDAIIAEETARAARRRLGDVLDLASPGDADKLLDVLEKLRKGEGNREARGEVAEERGVTRQAVDNVFTRARKAAPKEGGE
jgi:hypothetical protein